MISRSKSPSCLQIPSSKTLKTGPALKVGITIETSGEPIVEGSGSATIFRVKLSQQGSGYALHYLRLLGRQILLPAPGSGLAVELALPFFLLRDVLPGVLLHRSGQLFLLHGDLKPRVDAFHGPQSVRPEPLVLDQHLTSFVSIVGLFSLSYVFHVLLGPDGYGYAGTIPLFSSPVLPTAFPVSVVPRGDDVPGVSDQKHHPALWQRLHQQGRTHRTPRLLDHQVVVSLRCLREPCIGPLQNECSYRSQPGFFVSGREDKMLALVILEPQVVGVEERPHPRLEPHGVSCELTHHPDEPGAPRAPGAEDPHYVLRAYALGSRARRRPADSPVRPSAPLFHSLPDLLGPLSTGASGGGRCLHSIRPRTGFRDLIANDARLHAHKRPYAPGYLKGQAVPKHRHPEFPPLNRIYARYTLTKDPR